MVSAVVDEFSLLTGRELALFLDRTSMDWGDAWRKRIDDALDSSTLLIPVLTPRYFSRPECRKELLTFYGPAEGLGLRKLILPVLFANIPGFDEKNPDELIATASRFQYLDWTDLRLASPHSETVMRAVNVMASRIDKVLSEIAATEPTPFVASEDVEGDPGLIELLEGINSILPDWLGAVQEDEVLVAQYMALGETFRRRRERSNPNQRIAILHQEAQAEEPIASRELELSQSYYAKTLELHPLVTSLIRFIRLHPEHHGLVAELSSAVDEAMLQIERGREFWALPGRVDAAIYWRENAHLSRLMSRLADLNELDERYRAEANAVVESWARDLAAHLT